jgi:hypothetical protein
MRCERPKMRVGRRPGGEGQRPSGGEVRRGWRRSAAGVEADARQAPTSVTTDGDEGQAEMEMRRARRRVGRRPVARQ